MKPHEYVDAQFKAGVEEGRQQALTQLREAVESKTKDEGEAREDGQVPFGKTMRARGYNTALQDILAELDKLIT